MNKILLGLIFLFICQIGQTQAKGGCAYSYVPPHTDADLLEVREWAIGGAFIHFAKKAGYRWDKDLYLADAPSMEIFNFGLVTATSCFQLDIMSGFFGAMTHLAMVYKKSQDSSAEMEMSFEEAYTRIAESYGFDKYLSPDDVGI